MTDELGLCPTCQAPLMRQTDRRKAAGYSLRCSKGGHTRPSIVGRRRRTGTPGTRRPRANRPVGPKLWMADHSRAVCSHSGCFFDAGSCEHGSRRFYEPVPERAEEPAPQELDGILY